MHTIKKEDISFIKNFEIEFNQNDIWNGIACWYDYCFTGGIKKW